MSISNPGSFHPRHCEDARSRVFFVVLIYTVFLVTAGFWIVSAVRYKGISEWPCVEAKILDYGGKLQSLLTQGRFGTSSTTLDSQWVKFEYTVAGKSYIGNQAGPDTNGLPGRIDNRGRIDNSAPWRAFYDPDNPGIAVFDPAEFQGTGLLIVAAFSGAMAAFHFWFTLLDYWEKKTKAE
jgi:hypothetical protein